MSRVARRRIPSHRAGTLPLDPKAARTLRGTGTPVDRGCIRCKRGLPEPRGRWRRTHHVWHRCAVWPALRCAVLSRNAYLSHLVSRHLLDVAVRVQRDARATAPVRLAGPDVPPAAAGPRPHTNVPYLRAALRSAYG